MRRASPHPHLSLLAVHDAALLAAIFYAPVYWGQFATHTFYLRLGEATFAPSGLGLVTLLVSVAALAALAWRWSARRGPAVLPNAIHLPALLFIALSALTTLTSVAVHFSLLELTRLVTGALFFLLVANRALLPAAPLWPTLGYFLALLPFTLAAQAPGESPFLFDLLIWGAAGGVAVLHYTERDAPNPVRRWMEALVLSSGLVVGVWGVREWVNVVATSHDPGWAIFSTFFNANPLGGFFVIVLPLALTLALTSRLLWQKLLLLFSALAILAGLLCTHSKGAFLALGLAAVVFVLLRARASRRPRRAVGLTLAGAAALAVVAAVALAAAPGLRSKALGAFGEQRAPNMFRVLTWQGTWAMARHHPVLGVGPGAFESAYMNYAVAGFTRAAHESFLQVASEQGFAGLAAFLWIFGAAFFTAWRTLSDADRDPTDRLLAVGLASGLAGFLGHSLFDYDWYLGAVALAVWFAFGALGHLAQGRPLPVLAVPEPSAPAKGKARRRGAEPAPARPVPAAPEHALPWPRGEAGRAVGFLAAAGVLGLFFWFATRGAMAQGAKERADQALAAYQAEALQAEAQGVRSEAAGYYLAQAVEGYRQAAQEDPSWAEPHELYGKTMEGSLPAEAERELKTAVACEPMNFRYRLSLANFYAGQHRWQEALAAYEEALRHFPHYTLTLRYLARLYEGMGNEAEALRTYQRLLEVEKLPIAKYPALSADTDVDTNFAFAHYALACAALRDYRQHPDRKALRRARQALDRGLAIIDEYHLGAAKTDAMFAAAGMPRVNRSAELDPLEAKSRFRLAGVLALLHREDSERRAQLARALELFLRYPEARKELATEDAKGGA